MTRRTVPAKSARYAPPTLLPGTYLLRPGPPSWAALPEPLARPLAHLATNLPLPPLVKPTRPLLAPLSKILVPGLRPLPADVRLKVPTPLPAPCKPAPSQRPSQPRTTRSSSRGTSG